MPRPSGARFCASMSAPGLIGILGCGILPGAYAKTRLDPFGQMPGIGSSRIGQFLHFGRIAVKQLELGEVVESATRYVVDEGFRRSAVGQNDLVRLGLDVIDRVALAKFRQRNAGYRRSVDQGARFAENAVDEDGVVCGDGQISMR